MLEHSDLHGDERPPLADGPVFLPLEYPLAIRVLKLNLFQHSINLKFPCMQNSHLDLQPSSLDEVYLRVFLHHRHHLLSSERKTKFNSIFPSLTVNLSTMAVLL